MELRCPICHARGKRLYQWTSPYVLASCSSCRTLFADPMPSDEQLQEFYQGFLYRKPEAGQLRRLVEAKKRELRNLFGDDLQTGRTFLDYGGGTGVASLAAAELGLQVTMFELDREAVEHVHSLEGCSVEAFSSLDAIEGRAFDLVFSDNVIEHVQDPKALLARLYGHLKPRGRMVVKTPNARNTELLFHPMVVVKGYLLRVRQYNGLWSALSGVFVRPWALDPPRHLYAFSANSLKLLAEQVGADEAEIGYYRIPLWEYSLAKRLNRVPKSAVGAVKWGVLALLSVAELATKAIEWPLRKMNLLSPGGVFIRIRRQ